MKFTYNGTVYDFDTESLTVAEGREVKKYTGMSLSEWQQGLESVDADAMAALVYTAVHRGGGTIEWSDLDSMNLVDFANSIVRDNNLDPDALQRGEVRPLLTEVKENRADRRGAAKSGSKAASRATPARRPAARS